jgi:hypothetical protein
VLLVPTAGAAKIRVSLTVRGAATGLTAGSFVVLTAKAKLAKGDRLQIRRHASNSRVWHVITECASSPCSAGWIQRRESSVGFAARAIHRKGGRTGRVDAVLGTSRAVVVTWYALPPAPLPAPAPPPPPAPPVALAGTYCGSNDQGKSTCIEVTAGGAAVTSFTTELALTCTVGLHWQLHPAFAAVVPVGSDLSFSLSYTSTETSVFSTSSLVVTYSITGRLDTVGNVTGTVGVDPVSWDQNGQHVSCPSMSIGWRAKRVA